jgi:hypothetical protein
MLKKCLVKIAHALTSSTLREKPPRFLVVNKIFRNWFALTMIPDLARDALDDLSVFFCLSGIPQSFSLNEILKMQFKLMLSCLWGRQFEYMRVLDRDCFHFPVQQTLDQLLPHFCLLKSLRIFATMTQLFYTVKRVGILWESKLS